MGDERPESLDRAVKVLLGQAAVQTAIARLKLDIQASPEPFVWSVVDCEALGGILPADIKSGWIFVLRRDTPSGAHHHPNSVQHMVVIEGSGYSVIAGKKRAMLRHRHGSEPDEVWHVIGRNVVHEFFPEKDDMVVISFHTCQADELVEVEEGSGHSRRYEQAR